MLFHWLVSLIFSVAVVVMLDFGLVLRGVHFKLSLYVASLVGMCILLGTSGVSAVWMLSVLCAGVAVWMLARAYRKRWASFSPGFADVDEGKVAMYGGKKVLLVVPHQDDEINVLGGVFEEYLKYGSRVFIVYAITNGRIGGQRYQEALQLCAKIGIPKEQVFFLGYGSWCDKPNPFPKRTCGTDDVPAYREGRAYTRANMVDDLRSLMLRLRPDVIYGSDYDDHIDHHWVTLATDEALGQVLKEEPMYRPLVLKGYAYRTTWESYPDYYGRNIRSTLYRKATVETYPWEERLRLPIAAHLLNRSLLRSEIYAQYGVFSSQGAVMRAVRFNTDKVVWRRNSDSLLLRAMVEVSSGDGSKLNDFLLYDKDFTKGREQLPDQGAWVPTRDDKRREAVFTLQEQSDIDDLLIYQNPAEVGTVDRVAISFDGEEATEHTLRSDGYPTRIAVYRKNICSLTIRIVSSRGACAGLTEVEAVVRRTTFGWGMVKLMTREGDFMYDYWLRTNGKELVGLYTAGDASPLSVTNYEVSVSNPKCRATIVGDALSVECPRRETTRLCVKSKDGRYADTVVISNPSWCRRTACRWGQAIEAAYYDIFIGDQHRKATTLSLMYMIKQRIHVVRM